MGATVLWFEEFPATALALKRPRRIHKSQGLEFNVDRQLWKPQDFAPPYPMSYDLLIHVFIT